MNKFSLGTTQTGSSIPRFGTSGTMQAYGATRRLANAQDLRDKQQEKRIRELENKVKELEK